MINDLLPGPTLHCAVPSSSYGGGRFRNLDEVKCVRAHIYKVPVCGRELKKCNRVSTKMRRHGEGATEGEHKRGHNMRFRAREIYRRRGHTASQDGKRDRPASVYYVVH